jgi:FkbM family methyltransferase
MSLNRRIYRAVADTRRHAVNIPGCGLMYLNKVDLVNLYLYYFGTWEPGISRVATLALRPGDIFIDVGANIGYYTLLASNIVGADGQVIAIEASPTVFQTLKEHVRLNGATNVRFFNVAAADVPGELEIFKGPRDNVGTTSTLPGYLHRFEARVPALPLDSLLQGVDLSRVKCIKIDVEGGEYQVVAGMRETISELPKDVTVLLEVAVERLRALNYTLDGLLTPFTSQGFRLFRVENRYDEAFYVNFQSPQIAACTVEDLVPNLAVDLLITRTDPSVLDAG